MNLVDQGLLDGTLWFSHQGSNNHFGLSPSQQILQELHEKFLDQMRAGSPSEHKHQAVRSKQTCIRYPRSPMSHQV